MTTETILRNARIALPDEIVTGAVLIRDGRIAGIDSGPAAKGEDLEGDYLIPGLIELHTDHLETHYAPRPGVRWPMAPAIQAHDAQIATAGITTVFDCLRMGSDEGGGFEPGEMRKLADAIVAAGDEGRLRAQHFLHLRCEVSAPDVLEHIAHFEGVGAVRLVSLMDHAPGQRQFQTLEQYSLYYKTQRGLSDEEFARFCAARVAESDRYSAPHRQAIAALCREKGVALASHDDATLDHVAEAVAEGVSLAEFPTTIAAARASHEAGLKVMMGGPNIVRGGSHSGNIAAMDLARAGILDVISSDYVPFSMILAAFTLADDLMDLPQALRLVTANPADAVGFTDRGRIAAGLRADLVQVRANSTISEGRAKSAVPQVRAVWTNGARVA